MADRRELGAIFLGGSLGTLLRAGLLEVAGEGASGWPWATFGVNVVGAFLIGYLVGALPPASRHRPLWTTGFCGGLTTFSALQLELLKMLEAGQIATAVAYAGASLLAGLVGVQSGVLLGRRPRSL
jgi:CrcB protein